MGRDKRNERQWQLGDGRGAAIRPGHARTGRAIKTKLTVIGFDLDNEQLGYPGMPLKWRQGGPDDLWQMYTTVANHILGSI